MSTRATAKVVAGTGSKSSAALMRRGGSNVVRAGQEGVRILVVDDDERNLYAIEKVLEEIAEVVCVGSGEEALKYLLESDCAVILLDVFMPGLDGYETAQLIRSRERSRHIPIIFLSAVHKETDHLLRGYAMGAVDYVFKPVEPAILESKAVVFVELYTKTLEIQRKAEQEQKLLEENFRVRAEHFMAQEALRRSEERQAMIIQSLPIALYAGTPGQERLAPQFMSGKIEAICGFKDEIFVRTPGFWVGRIHPADRERVLAEFARLPKSGALAVEYRWMHADEKYRVFFDQAVLVRDDHGNPKEIVGTLLDVTERRLLEQQLVHAQKMDAIGKLTGGVAHDFNNMLTVVIGSLDRLKRQLVNDPQAVKRVDLALEGATRCADLTRQLLAFSRHQALQSRPVDLNSVVATVTDMVRRILGERIELVISPSEELWSARTDPTQVESALINLVVNARDAMPNGGRLSITTRNVPKGDRALEDLGRTSEDFVALCVADTGVGIPSDLLERVFDPFFTTKESGKGTGLGLSIIYGFVKQSGGHIRLDSEPGSGTRAVIYLPRSLEEAKVVSGNEETRAAHRARDREVVLAVEDDPAVRGFALETLRELGYHVLEAADGDAAMALLASGKQIDLLFTDFAMPGSLNGRELARKVNVGQPHVKVLLTSAYTDQFISDAGASATMRFLRKPYRVDELAEAIRHALDEL